jgi:hypothetical protein
LALPDLPFTARLQVANRLGSERITHRVDLTRAEEVDAEVESWLRAAYERDA